MRLKQERQRLIAKCSFLRDEVRRSASAGDAFADSIDQAYPSSTDVIDTAQLINAWLSGEAQREALAAREAIAKAKVRDCDAGVLLSDVSRMAPLESLRGQHLATARTRWEGRAGSYAAATVDALLSQLNAVYDTEQHSFGQAQSGQQFIDPDIPKEFPGLIALIATSGLDVNTKDLFTQQAGLLRFSEAGRLYRALGGADSSAGLGPAYRLRPILLARARLAGDSIAAAALAARQEEENLAAARRQESAARRRTTIQRGLRMLKQSSIYLVVLIALVGPIWLVLNRYGARVRAIRDHATRYPYWGGAAEWVLWDPGETVVLLRNKVLVPVEAKEEQGGITSISPWRGEEYKGRISSKTQLFAWKSESILTADGLPIRFRLGIWWTVRNPRLYVSRIAAEYHEDGKHQRDSLMGAAENWLEKIAAGTLREQVSKLPSARVISSRAEAFLEVNQGSVPDSLSFANEITTTLQLLDAKTRTYGIEVERIEVQELELPPEFQKTIEEMRRAYIEPGMALLEAQAYATRENTKTDVEMNRLQRLRDVIGKEAVATKEILKEVNLAGLANPLIAAVPIIQPFSNAVLQSAEKGLSPGSLDADALKAKKLPAPEGTEQGT